MRAAKRKRVIGVSMGIAAVLMLYSVSGFFLVPRLIERHLPIYAAKRLHGSLAIGQVRFNPFTLRLSVSDLKVADDEGAAILTAKQLSAALGWSSLVRGTWTFSKIRLERPHLNVERGADGRINLASLIRKPDPKDPAAKPPRILIQQLSLIQGSLRLSDPELAEIGEKQDITLDAIDLSLSNLSTLPNRSGAYTADAALASGGSLAWEGDLSLVPFASHGSLAVTKLPALSVWKLLRERLAIAAPQGEFDASASYRFSWEERAFQIDRAQVNATGLTFAKLKDPGVPLLRGANIAAEGGRLDFQRREIMFPHIAVRGGGVRVALAPDGSLNWKGLLRPPARKQAPRPWSIRLVSAAIENVAVVYIKANRATPVTASALLTTGKLGVSWTIGAGMFAVKLEDVDGKLTDFRLFEPGSRASLVRADSASLEGGRLDSKQRWLAANVLTLNGGGSALGRDPKGRTMVAGLTRADLALRPVQTASADAKLPVRKPPWRYALRSLALKRFDLAWVDRGFDPVISYRTHVLAARITSLGLGFDRPSAFEVALQVGAEGRIDARGSLAQDRRRAEGTIKAARIPLAPLAPLAARYTTLEVHPGPLSAAASFSYRAGQSASSRTSRNGAAVFRLDKVSAQVAGVSVSAKNSKTPLVRLDSVSLQGGELATDRKRIAAGALKLTGGGAALTRDRDGRIALFDALRGHGVNGDAQTTGSGKRARSDGAPWRYAVSRLALEKFDLKLADRSFQPAIAYDVEVLSARLENVDLGLDQPMSFDAALQVDRKGRIGANGKLAQDGRQAHGKIEAANIPLTPLAPLMARYSALKVNAGPLSAAGSFNYRAGRSASGSSRHGAAAWRLENVSAQVANLALFAQGAAAPLASIDSASVRGGKLDTDLKRIAADTIALRGGGTSLVRDAAGRIALFDQLRGDSRKNPAAVTKTKTPARDQSWRYVLGALTLETFDLELEDRGFDPAVALAVAIRSARFTNVDRGSGRPIGFEAAVQAGPQGRIDASGSLAQDWTTAQTKIRIAEFALAPLAPVLRRFANLDVISGRLAAAGSLNYRRGSVSPSIGGQGSLTVADILVNQAGTAERFISWRTLTADQLRFMRASGARPWLEIEDILVDAPNAALEIAQDNTLNVKEIAPDKAKAVSLRRARAGGQRTASNSGEGLAIRLNRLRIANGTLQYRDDSLVLPFSTRIEALNGALVNISNASGARARLSAEGRIAPYGFARIRGAIAIFSPAKFTDVRAGFDNVLMVPLSPYTATFAGRRIDSGKLWLDVHYKILDKALSGTNNIRLENFQLGEKIAAPNASGVPWDLAVALLTDAQGSLEISVPVKGNLGGPRFNYRVLIAQAFRNVAQRVVSAPFRWGKRLLGLGRGKGLEAIEFEPGRVRLLPAEQEKLDRLASALRAGPRLGLKVPAPYDKERDAASLSEQRVRGLLAAALGEPLAVGQALEPIAFESARTQRALEQILAESSGSQAALEPRLEQNTSSKIDRPGGIVSPRRGASDDIAFYAALFRRLVELHPPSPQALQALGERRAQAIETYLVRNNGIDSGRIETAGARAADRDSDPQVSAQLSLNSIERQP